jgi:enterochelin esterase-like enzyme
MPNPDWQELQHPDLADAKVVSRIEQGHRVDVYVPGDVRQTTPILVMHDGKNLFWSEHSSVGDTWGVIPAVQRLRVRPVVVGVWGLIDATVPNMRDFELGPQRLLESQPSLWGSMLAPPNISSHELLGDEYHDMIAKVLLPEISQNLGITLGRTRTALCGSSLGGLTSLYGVSRYPDVYGTALSLSTHWAEWDPEIVDLMCSLIPVNPRPRIWLDRGTEELDALYEGLHERAVDLLLGRGWAIGQQLQGRVFPGTNHSERVWCERLPEVLTWWLQGISL